MWSENIERVIMKLLKGLLQLLALVMLLTFIPGTCLSLIGMPYLGIPLALIGIAAGLVVIVIAVLVPGARGDMPTTYPSASERDEMRRSDNPLSAEMYHNALHQAGLQAQREGRSYQEGYREEMQWQHDNKD